MGVGTMSREGYRKIRSDKKRDVKPTINLELKDAIYRLSYVSNTPVKDLIEWLVLDAIRNQKILTRLVGYFKRDLVVDGTLYVGNHEREQFSKLVPGKTEKVTTRFTQYDYARIYDFSYTLEVSPSRAVAILLEFAMSDIPTVNKCLKSFIKHELTDNQVKEINKLNKYVLKKAHH